MFMWNLHLSSIYYRLSWWDPILNHSPSCMVKSPWKPHIWVANGVPHSIHIGLSSIPLLFDGDGHLGCVPFDRPNYVGWCWLAILIRSHSCPILTSQTRLLAFSEPFAFNFDPASASFPKEPRLKWVPAWSRCLLLPDWKRNLWWATPRSCELRCWSVDFHRSLALLVNSPIGLPQGI